MLAFVVLLDPGVDCLRRNGAVSLLLLHPARDLGRRPLLSQSLADGLVDLGIVNLPIERSFTPPLFRLALRLSGVVFIPRAVTMQLATDRRRTSPQGFGDFLLIGLLMPQLRYAIPFFGRKMTCHRWDSVPL